MQFPLPPIRDNVHHWIIWRNAFGADEVKRCIDLCETLPKSGGTTFDSGTAALPAASVRRSQVSWVEPTPQSTWLFDKVAYLCNDMNSKFFRFDLSGIYEPLQYTVYEPSADGKPGHYTWHMDRGDNITPRKLSIVVQLSSPTDYTGGDLELFFADPGVKAPRGLGHVAAFPSFLMHRVTAVTQGVRRSLVIWVGGPGFR
jgi:PKHD-type hydroxylase